MILKKFPAFEPFVVGAPDDLFFASCEKRDMFGAVDVRFFYADNNPRLWAAGPFAVTASHAGSHVG